VKSASLDCTVVVAVAAAAVIIGESNSAPERLGQLNWSVGTRKEREIK
jgi:hypothetical protein